MNTLEHVRSLGQGIWLDYIQRRMIESGELKRLVDEVGVSGLTSNPSIFEKAVKGSHDYDQAIAEAAAKGLNTQDIYEELAFKDITEAAKLLEWRYDQSKGTDGFVSIEVSPHLAYDIDETVREVNKLHTAIDRRNLLVKVPGTPEGVEVIKEVVGQGHSINVTLMFSISNYEAVARAYIEGLVRLRANGGDISRAASVASFFLSRIDTSVDKQIDALIDSHDAHEEEIKGLRGQAAIVVAKTVYQRFLNIFSGPLWEELESGGARIQKPLWASTSTKDPAYVDTKYVDPLIGPNTINTLPLATIEAFLDHGTAASVVAGDPEGTAKTLERFGELGIDLEQVADDLQVEGVGLFIDSYDSLMAAIEEKKIAVV